MTHQHPIVTLQQVDKVYHRGENPVQALSGVDVTVEAGEFLALLGPSGCGKSTLLNLVGGLDQVTRGELWLDGQRATQWTSDQWTAARRSLIGIVFQAFHLLPGLTAAENVALPLVLQGTAVSLVRERVEELLTAVGLPHRAGHRPSELSGGEQQRIAVARALVHRPKLLLADEPTGNLDSESADAVIALLRRLPQQYGCTIMLATHSQAAADHADRHCVMKDGRIQAVRRAVETEPPVSL
ncbi:MAG: ABC transporter ATP-binding protein [Nitrospiraceae bacterium]